MAIERPCPFEVYIANFSPNLAKSMFQTTVFLSKQNIKRWNIHTGGNYLHWLAPLYAQETCYFYKVSRRLQKCRRGYKTLPGFNTKMAQNFFSTLKGNKLW